MSFVLTILADNSGEFDGSSVAPLNNSVKSFVLSLPKDVKVRLIRYSDFAMWHIGPEPVSVDEIEWVNIPSGGFLSSLAHAVNLAGQTLISEKCNERQVLLLISDGALSDPEEVVRAVLKKYFSSGAAERYAVSSVSGADETVLRLFAGENILPHSVLLDASEFLSYARVEASHPPHSDVSLTCTVTLGDGNLVTVGVTGRDVFEAKVLMKKALGEFGKNDEDTRKCVQEYADRVL